MDDWAVHWKQNGRDLCYQHMPTNDFLQVRAVTLWPCFAARSYRGRVSAGTQAHGQRYPFASCTFERDGLVRQSGERRSGGKPAYVYELTPQARQLFLNPIAWS